jgi:hypothetical protein
MAFAEANLEKLHAAVMGRELVNKKVFTSGEVEVASQKPSFKSALKEIEEMGIEKFASAVEAMRKNGEPRERSIGEMFAADPAHLVGLVSRHGRKSA